MGRPHSTRAKGGPKSGTDEIIGKRRSSIRYFAPVLAELKAIFPRKLAQELALLTNRSERICEVWISRRGAPDGEALTALLTGRHGDRLFLALSKGCSHPWRADLGRKLEAGRLRREYRALGAQLAALETEDRE